jgi:hypothetical protein
MFRRKRTLAALIASAAAALVVAPTAHAAIDGGKRNPRSNTSSGFSRETQIIADIAQHQGGFAADTGGFATRQSNKSDSGGGAIYGCRAKAGTESCVAANNLADGDAFRFQATPSAAAIGRFRFGLDVDKLVDKPPFVTNGTGLVKNLNADQVDGHSAEDFMPAGSVEFAVVNADGTIAAKRGVPQNGRATVATANGHTTFTVPFSSDLSTCAATATPTDIDAPKLAVAPGGADKNVTVTEDGTTPFGFQLQVTC